MTQRDAATGVVAIVPLDPDSPAVRWSVAGRPVLDLTLEALAAVPEVRRVVIGAWGDAGVDLERAVSGSGETFSIRAGGDRWAGMLAAVASAESQAVLVQEASRPLVSPASITALIQAWPGEGAAVLVSDVVSTIKEVEAGVVVRTVPREQFRSIQGTWLFPRATLEIALRRAIAGSWPGPISGSTFWMIPAMPIGQPGRKLPSAPFTA